jgi:hypothetical protein
VIVYVFDRRRLLTPIGVAIVFISYTAWRGDWFSLLGLPLIYLGWCCCAPNLNLADGCLPLVATAVTFVLGAVLGLPGLVAVAVACGATWFVASLESAWRCMPEE